MSNVKLGIRVRPFTERELRSDKERTSVVNIIDENTVTITNVKVSLSGAGDSRARVRRYSADFALDSACPPNHSSYASQAKVFDKIGREVVECVARGSSACVLAYGQSATGKTYTMMGTEDDPGLVPRICRALATEQPFEITVSFDKISREVSECVARASSACVLAYGQSATGLTYTMMGMEDEPGLVPRICRALAAEQPFEITVSFLEIYNERVHDLLVGESPSTCHSLPRRRGNARKDLRVREHPGKGAYVQNLRRVAIHSVEALLALVDEGAKRRRTAATRRNTTSSRSHALLELATSTATLHLADLAGSEKAGWEGCGGRQKEGANINKSLVALSNVISALVSGGGRGRFVPYRDSALTWLLKDCFTGGATTFIIATVSPSVACYGESASTLRWAARARQLPNTRAIAAPPPVTRAALQAQYTQLLAELARNYIRYVPETGKIAYEEKHWDLNSKNIGSQLVNHKTANIGNIMNLLHPITDAQSESTASSVASGSSDVINNSTDKNVNIDITDEISQEVDNLFIPSLERTQSINDLKVIAPLRHKRRQYKSQEVLPIDETIHLRQFKSNVSKQSEAQINDFKNNIDKSRNSQIPVLYDNNQRAEIVASVTERLYQKMKKKEEAAAAKMESVIDKKIMEPLSELRICTNARQRLVELSQKALRNKRRIGIPAYTQTRKMVTRVRDQSIDAQTDLEAYFPKFSHNYSLKRDVATETLPMTPRCKEAAVGSKYGMIRFSDRSTATEEKKISHRNSLVMTDIVRKSDSFTQTNVVPPPRRKKHGCCCKFSKAADRTVCENDRNASIINISISQSYPADSETQSSDENSEIQVDNYDKPSSVNMTPDLLTNHNTTDLKPNLNGTVGESKSMITNDCTKKIDLEIINGQNRPLVEQRKLDSDFSDSDDCSLPRVVVDGTKPVNPDEIRDLILGRNEDSYPYNIILSPPRDRDQSKVIVKFQDRDVAMTSKESQTIWERSNEKHENLNIENDVDINNCYSDLAVSCSNSTESSKTDSDSFVWQNNFTEANIHKPKNSLDRSYTPVYKSGNPRNKKAKTKMYKEFLGLDKEIEITTSDSADSRDIFRRRRNYLESMLGHKPSNGNLNTIERGLLHSCNSLERSVHKYEKYIVNHPNATKYSKTTRTPTEYLQHLVQLRREVVKRDYDTDSSIGYLPGQ